VTDLAALPVSEARRLRRRRRAARMAVVPELKAICEACGHYYERVRHWFEEQPGEQAAAVAATEDPQLDLPCCELLGRTCWGGRTLPTHAALIAALHGGECPQDMWDAVLGERCEADDG